MTASSKLFEFIEREEGFVPHVYTDSAGIFTIGIGSTMYKNGKRVKAGDPPITKAQAYELLAWEVENKTAAIRGLIGNIALNQNQFDSLCSLVYNIGVGGFAISSLLKQVKTNPNDCSVIKTAQMDDYSVAQWFEKHGIHEVPLIKYLFAKWCKITVNGRKVLNDGLIRRRIRESDLYLSKQL